MQNLTRQEIDIQLAAARAEEARKREAETAGQRRIAELEAQRVQVAKVEAAQRLAAEADHTRKMADDIQASAAPVYAKLTEVHAVLQAINADALLTALVRQIEQHAATVNRIKNDIGDEEWNAGRARMAEYMRDWNNNPGLAEHHADLDSKHRAQARIAALNLPETPSLNSVFDQWVNVSSNEAERAARRATLQKVLPSLFAQRTY